jgi:Uma2 family endonuclease
MTPTTELTVLPDHTQLPDSDGTFVTNFDEHPQSILLTDSIVPVLRRRHPDGEYAIGQNCGIYWHHTRPALEGVKAPDWFYVPDVPPYIRGQRRRSYVLWDELIAPLVILEFVSGDGSEERDRTPRQGKFWIYERVVHAPYYGIYEPASALVEVYRLVDDRYVRLTANERGHFPIAPLGIELGIWEGQYANLDQTWLRWWDSDGKLLLIGAERAERYAERLRAAGIDPDTI